MTDEIVTREQLVNMSLDGGSLEQFISGSDIEDVLTRLGQQYPTLAKAVRILMETGGWKAYETEAILLATTPLVNPSVGYAFDTKKLYLWNGTIWKDEGNSPLDLAKAYADQKATAAENNAILHMNNLVGQDISNGIYALVKDILNQSPIWIQDGDIGFTFLEFMTMLRVKNQLGLAGLVSDRIIPFHEDINRQCGAWLEDGLFQCAGVHPNVIEMIKDQLGPISGSPSNNVTNAAYPIVSDGASLRQFKAKAAKLKSGLTQQLRVIMTGDSWTEHKTITNEVLALVRAEYGEAGSGWISLGVENNQLDGISLAKAGTWAYADLNQVSSFPNGSGPDGFTLTSSTVDSTITVSGLAKGNQLTLFFGKTDGTFKYSVNGGADVTVVASSSGSAVQTATIPIEGASNIVFTMVSGTVAFFGMHLRQTSGSGVEVTKLGNGGSTGKDYLKISPTAQANFSSYLAPDLVVLILGTNDYRLSGNTVQTFKDGLTAIIDGYRTSNPNCGFILIAPGNSNAPPLIPLSDFRDAIYEVAQAKTCEFYNMYDDWNTWSIENANGQWADAYHVSKSGAYRIAQKLFKNFLEV
ncbi:GDSL-like Lipase/Acylhydrolase family protein [Acinetobacter baumannii 573719]|nr:GDSL-like Lipase/Acylhydrolase family protein [Acinetobacter baumannii 573719]